MYITSHPPPPVLLLLPPFLLADSRSSSCVGLVVFFRCFPCILEERSSLWLVKANGAARVSAGVFTWKEKGKFAREPERRLTLFFYIYIYVCMCVSVKLSRICCRRVTTFFFFAPFHEKGQNRQARKANFMFYIRLLFFFFFCSELVSLNVCCQPNLRGCRDTAETGVIWYTDTHACTSSHQTAATQAADQKEEKKKEKRKRKRNGTCGHRARKWSRLGISFFFSVFFCVFRLSVINSLILVIQYLRKKKRKLLMKPLLFCFLFSFPPERSSRACGTDVDVWGMRKRETLSMLSIGFYLFFFVFTFACACVTLRALAILISVEWRFARDQDALRVVCPRVRVRAAPFCVLISM